MEQPKPPKVRPPKASSPDAGSMMDNLLEGIGLSRPSGGSA